MNSNKSGHSEDIIQLNDSNQYKLRKIITIKHLWFTMRSYPQLFRNKYLVDIVMEKLLTVYKESF